MDDFDFSLKKKKVKKEIISEANAAAVEEAVLIAENKLENLNIKDYTYEDLLNRLYNYFNQNNVSSSAKVRKLNVPKVTCSYGKTYWFNFLETCYAITREPLLVLNFFKYETNTQCSVNPRGEMTIFDKLTQRDVEVILRKYIKEYIICLACKSGDTIIDRKNKLDYIICNNCKSERVIKLVKPIQQFEKVVKD